MPLPTTHSPFPYQSVQRQRAPMGSSGWGALGTCHRLYQVSPFVKLPAEVSGRSTTRTLAVSHFS